MTYFSDYAQGFGGKFGVQQDRQDRSAVGWEHVEQTEKHSSQKGSFFISLTFHLELPDCCGEAYISVEIFTRMTLSGNIELHINNIEFNDE